MVIKYNFNNPIYYLNRACATDWEECTVKPTKNSST